MFCVKCGAKLADDAKFCHSCGTKTEVQETQGISLFENKETPKNDSVDAMKKLIGSNDAYYLEQFEKINKGEKPKFNWAAFLFGFYHAMYRNMWRENFKVFIGPIFVEALGVIMFLLFVDTFNFDFVAIGGALRLLGAVWMLIVHIWYGKNFNKLYEEHVNKALWNVRDSFYLQAETSMARALILIAITIISGIALQSYLTSKMLNTSYSEVPEMGSYESDTAQNEVLPYEEHLPTTYENTESSADMAEEIYYTPHEIFNNTYNACATPIFDENYERYSCIENNTYPYVPISEWTNNEDEIVRTTAFAIDSGNIDLLGDIPDFPNVKNNVVRIEGTVLKKLNYQCGKEEITLLTINNVDGYYRLYIRGNFTAEADDKITAWGTVFNSEDCEGKMTMSIATCYLENRTDRG